MRKYLKTVPVFIPAGSASVETADREVAAGRAYSLRGKALMVLDRPHLEQLLAEIDADPEIAAMILRAAARIESEKVAAAAASAVRAQGDATESQ